MGSLAKSSQCGLTQIIVLYSIIYQIFNKQNTRNRKLNMQSRLDWQLGQIPGLTCWLHETNDKTKTKDSQNNSKIELMDLMTSNHAKLNPRRKQTCNDRILDLQLSNFEPSSANATSIPCRRLACNGLLCK